MTNITCALAMAIAAASGSPTWRALDIPDGLRYDDISFVDPEEGWAVNELGEIWHTDDGGASWTRQFFEEFLLFRSVGFVDAQKGWAGTLDSERTLFRTDDGGQTWIDISDQLPEPRPTGICGFTVVDESVAYGVGVFGCCAMVIKTTDGGETWTSQDLSDLAGGLVDVRFTSPTHGLIGGSSLLSRPAIFGTTDGGETWELRHESVLQLATVWKMHFPSEPVGYASIELAPVFFKTIDGGQTWTDVPYNGQQWQQGIGFATETLGWNGGRPRLGKPEEDQTYRTENGGDTWEVDPFGKRLNRFQFFGPDLGYAAGDVIYKYSIEPVDVDASTPPADRRARGYPNPFRPRTTIAFSLDSGDRVDISVYDTVGRHLRTLVDERLDAGTHAVEWDGTDDQGRDVPPGVYLYIVRSPHMNAMGKLVRVD